MEGVTEKVWENQIDIFHGHPHSTPPKIQQFIAIEHGGKGVDVLNPTEYFRSSQQRQGVFGEPEILTGGHSFRDEEIRVLLGFDLDHSHLRQVSTDSRRIFRNEVFDFLKDGLVAILRDEVESNR